MSLSEPDETRRHSNSVESKRRKRRRLKRLTRGIFAAIGFVSAVFRVIEQMRRWFGG